MSKEKVKNGIVAFFDILGYKKIVENNDIIVLAKFVSDVLVKLPGRAREEISKLAPLLSTDKKYLQDELEKLTKPLSISDSILLTTSLRGNEGNDQKGATWLLFLIVCMILTRQMFQRGLPARGAIGYGEYFVKNHCFAGMSIVEAYELSNMLEFSGCALTENARKKLKELLDGKIFENAQKIIEAIIVEYPAPLKNCERKKLSIIDFSEANYSAQDIRQMVVDSFLGYNKDISEPDMKKVINTDMMIRFFVKKRKKKKLKN